MSLAGRLSARVPPDAAIVNAAHRASMALRAPRVARRGDRASRALAAALRATALDRFTPGERAWIDRIEARRAQLAREHANADGAPEAWAPPRAWSIPRVWGRFLLRLVAELAPRSCIELGAGFGISGLYQAAALELNGAGKLTTLDQEQSLIPTARQGFAQVGLEQRIELVSGPIEQTLAGVAERQAPIDYAFVDAEHTEAAMLHDFDALRPHLAKGAVVVFDDIRTSEGMKRAWAAIQSRPGTTHPLDLRRLGIVVVSSRSESR